MLNYIRMDLFKLFRSKAFYILTIIFLLMNLMTIRELRLTEHDVISEADMEQHGFSVTDSDGEEIVGVNAGVSVDTTSVVLKGITLESCMTTLYSGNLILFILVLIVTNIVCNDFATGFIKNTITIPRHRWYANISKLAVSAVAIVIENVLAAIMFVISIELVFDKAEIGNLTFMFRYLGIEMLLTLAILALIIFIGNLTKSRTITIIIGVMVAMQMITGLIVVPISGLFKVNAEKLMKAFITMRATALQPDASVHTMLECVAMAGIGIIVYMLLSNITLSKKDI